MGDKIEKRCSNCINFFQSNGNPNCKICDWNNYTNMNLYVLEWIKRNTQIGVHKYDFCPEYKYFKEEIKNG